MTEKKCAKSVKLRRVLCLWPKKSAYFRTPIRAKMVYKEDFAAWFPSKGGCSWIKLMTVRLSSFFLRVKAERLSRQPCSPSFTLFSLGSIVHLSFYQLYEQFYLRIVAYFFFYVFGRHHQNVSLFYSIFSTSFAIGVILFF